MAASFNTKLGAFKEAGETRAVPVNALNACGEVEGHSTTSTEGVTSDLEKTKGVPNSGTPSVCIV